MLFQLVLICACVSLCGACSCPDRSYPEAFCGYPVLFRGKALFELDVFNERYYFVQVDEEFQMPWSLKEAPVILVRTRTQSAVCGATFALNVSAVFAGSFSDCALRTTLCDPNIQWASLSIEHQRHLYTGDYRKYCSAPSKK